MKISDLDKMESIVKSNPSLKWEGWDVVFLEEKKSRSFMHKMSSTKAMPCLWC